MEEQDFLNKYGVANVFFEYSFKNSWRYCTHDGQIHVSGTGDYRSEMKKVMTINELWQELDDLHFRIVDETN